MSCYKKVIFFHKDRAIITSNKISNNSLILFNIQSGFKLFNYFKKIKSITSKNKSLFMAGFLKKSGPNNIHMLYISEVSFNLEKPLPIHFFPMASFLIVDIQYYIALRYIT